MMTVPFRGLKAAGRVGVVNTLTKGWEDLEAELWTMQQQNRNWKPCGQPEGNVPQS